MSRMKILVATVLSIALLLGNSVKLRASVTGPFASDGDVHASQACPVCCQEPAATPGIPGIPGQDGRYGHPGSKGDAGQKGQNGEIGPIGLMGERGAPGNAGLKGDDGIGPRGLPGLVGTTGQTGVKGQNGDIGPIGSKGEQGAAGNAGPKGDDGVKGQKGEPGEAGHESSSQRVAFTVRMTDSIFTSGSYDTCLHYQETEILLPGTVFDLDTGTFTCNVSGTYVFMFSVNKHSGSSSNNFWVDIRRNNEWVVSGRSSDPSANEQVSGSAVLALQRGDTVCITIMGDVYSGSPHHTTSFSGFLLYPE